MPGNILQFKFDHFASLPTGRDEVVTKLTTDMQQKKWELCLLPGAPSMNDGQDNTNDQSMVNLNLRAKWKGGRIFVKCSAIIRDLHGRSYCERNLNDGWSLYPRPIGEDRNITMIQRSTVLDASKEILVLGALLVDVYLQIKPECMSHHIPHNCVSPNWLRFLESKEESDVSFVVKSCSLHSPIPQETTIPSHRLILNINAPLLLEFCNPSTTNGSRGEGGVIEIRDTPLRIFKLILEYIYGGDPTRELPVLEGDDIKITTAKELIIAANKYNIVGLKLRAEVVLVECILIDSKNMAEWLRFADSMTCPLLMEHTTNYFIDRATDLIDTGHLTELLGSHRIMVRLIKELHTNLVNDSRYDGSGRDMTVDLLRTKLDEKDLDIDGPKETLIARFSSDRI